MYRINSATSLAISAFKFGTGGFYTDSSPFTIIDLPLTLVEALVLLSSGLGGENIQPLLVILLSPTMS